MTKQLINGNQAIALGALAAGVDVICGYPGTPSSEVIGSLYQRTDLEGTHVEWSTNEKVAVEVAAGTSWAGKRSLVTMKMSGLNVAYDSLIGIAYSGVIGGMVVYVADDPGVTTGMCEQDTRTFAQMSDMVILEPANGQQCHDFTKLAFTISEHIQKPVFVRGVTNTSQSYSYIEVEERVKPADKAPILQKDINKFTKAGAAICTKQHQSLIDSLNEAENYLRELGLNKLNLQGKIGIVTVGVTNTYISEAVEILNQVGANLRKEDLSTLQLAASLPFAREEMTAMLRHCDTIVVAEELEPVIERELFCLGYNLEKRPTIIGKTDGTFSRLGEYNGAIVAAGLAKAINFTLPPQDFTTAEKGEAMCAARPITTCSGCPHRGTYVSLNQAVKNLGYKKDEVMITGDIGCTILGMNPPYHTLWTELSMGASVPLAQGYLHSGVKTPVIATIGDSTFFHAGIPGLINAVQQNLDLTVIIMDNGWTAMTGMQVNPGTGVEFQRDGYRQIDILNAVKGLGIDYVKETDPYDLAATTAIIQEAIQTPGTSVVVCRRECAIQANRRKIRYNNIHVDTDACTLCKACINISGCPAITLGNQSIQIDPNQCNGCGICAQLCKFNAIQALPVQNA